MTRSLYHWVVEHALVDLAGRYGIIPHGMARDVAIVTTLGSIPTSVYQRAFVTLQHVVGGPLAKIHSPNVKPGTAPQRASVQSGSVGRRVPIQAQNYGVRRMGGRMLGTTFGALMIGEAMLPTLRMFISEEATYDAV